MDEKCVKLSKRLQMLSSMVTEGNRVADVGCDHGFLSIYLVQSGKVPSALAMDVRKGPLAAAKEHVEAGGLGEYITLRLSDGLKEYRMGEAETIVCAGMGGRLMERILAESIDKVNAAGELILQPQSELQEFRRFLREAGLAIREERAVWEDGKYYFAMRAIPGGNPPAEKVPQNLQEVFDRYGEKLLREKDPVLEQYLRFREAGLKRLQETLSVEMSERAEERILELDAELRGLALAKTFYKI